MHPSYRDHLLLLQAALARAEQSDFTARAHLQLSVSLVYRLMSLDPKQVDAYLALAFLFCVIDEWKRAQQILLYANRLLPQDKSVQRFLFQLQSRESVSEPEAQSDREFVLPDFQQLQNSLEQQSSVELANQFSEFRPILASLASRLFTESQNDE